MTLSDLTSTGVAGALVCDRYHLRQKLSEGGGGTVWEASDGDGSTVALKFLKWSPLKSPHVAADRFKNEFAILKSLSHPHISKIYDFGIIPNTNQYFFTTELLTGGDVRSQIGAPVEVIEDLLLQALRALEYLRNQRLLHLDIKPQNLLLRMRDEHPQLVLIDFGLADFQPPDRPGGTPNYMPPEVIVRRMPELARGSTWPAPDHRSDLYSLGVTFYTLLTGKMPFLRCEMGTLKMDPQETMRAHLVADPVPPSQLRGDIPAYLDRIILKLMARHPDDRYPSAAVAAQALRFRSGRRLSAESTETLLAYLPTQGKLIGRHAEKKIISDMLNNAARRTSHSVPVLAISGKKGVGRTRLLQHIIPAAQQLEMVTTSLDAADPHNTAQFPNLGAQQPHVVLVDNLDALFSAHSDDVNQREFLAQLQHFVRRLKLQQRLHHQPAPKHLLVIAFNNERISFDVLQRRLALDERCCTHIPLEPFSDAEISEYLENVLGEAPDKQIVKSLRTATEGNPLYVTEHLQQMISAGQLFTLAGRPDGKTLKALGVDFAHSVPALSLTKSILEKIAQLPQETQPVVHLLSCWQRPATLPELALGNDSQIVANHLHLLLKAGLVERTHGATFRFSNSMSGKIISEHLDPLTRCNWHDRIATYLSKKRSVDSAELDLHLAHGSNTDLRCQALQRLVQHHSQGKTPHRAIEHLHALLAEMPISAFQQRAEMIVQLARLYERAHQQDHAVQIIKMIAHLEGVPRTERRFLKSLMWEQLGLLMLRQRQLTEARRMLREARRILPRSSTHRARRLRITNYLAAVDLRSGRLHSARTLFARSWNAAQRLPKSQQLHILNNELGESLLSCGKPAQALRALQRELKHLQAAGALAQCGNRHYLLGEALRHPLIGRLDQARTEYEQALHLARAHRLLDLEVRTQNGLGNLHAKSGKYAKACEHYRAALLLAQHTESETVCVELMVNLGFALCRTHRVSDAIDYLEAALDFSGGPKGKAGVLIRTRRPEIFITLGDALYRKHHLERAITYLRNAMRCDRKHRLAPTLRYNLYGTLSEVYLAEGKQRQAHRLLPTLRRLLRRVPEARPHFKKLSHRIDVRASTH